MSSTRAAGAGLRCLGALLLALAATARPAQAAPGYEIFVTNERSGDLTVIDGSDFKVLATIPVGKRPRGIHVSPDGKTVYVALSGTPIEAPPQLDANGNPIFQKGKDDDDDSAEADKSADGIGVVDVAHRQLTGRIAVGSDPEEFALSQDGTKIYVSNEDIKTASVVGIADGKLQRLIPVGQEPEGVGTAPDGKSFYVTCEAGGDVYVIDAVSYQPIAHFKVDLRPRSVDFLPGSPIAFIPSESVAELNVIDTLQHSVIKTIALPPGSRPMRVRVAADGRRVYVSTGRAGTVAVLDTQRYELLATIPVGKRPWGIVLSPDGRYLFSANGPSNDVSVVDLQTNREVTRVKAGSSPWGLAIVPKGP
jgi:YVTN family beta-propeller protein